MKRLITLCFTVILLHPIWAHAQTAPQVIGTLTWAFSPWMSVAVNSPFCDPCGTYYIKSMTATITHTGNEMHFLSWKGDVGYTPNGGTSQDIELYFSAPGVGSMFLERSTYFGFMHTMITMPPNVFSYPPFSVPLLMSCYFDSATLGGYCVSQNGVTAGATLVKN